MNEAILKKALARYATPLYVFDADVLKKRVSFFKTSFTGSRKVMLRCQRQSLYRQGTLSHR